MTAAPNRRVVVVDGSNLATEGRTSPSLRQLDEAVRAYAGEEPGAEIVVVVDATFEHRIDPSERQQLIDAELHGEVVSPPAGAIGRGDAFVLRIAERTGARVLSNDSFQEFHAEHPWLFDEGRLVGGKPVPGVGWIFTPRIPVRGPRSRQATGKAKRDAAATLSPPLKAAELAKAAKKVAARKALVLPDGSAPQIGDVWPDVATKAAKAAKVVKVPKAAKAAKAAKATKATKAGVPTKATAATPIKAAKAVKAVKAVKKTAATSATAAKKTAATSATAAKKTVATSATAAKKAADKKTAVKETAKKAAKKSAPANASTKRVVTDDDSPANGSVAADGPGPTVPKKAGARNAAVGARKAAAKDPLVQEAIGRALAEVLAPTGDADGNARARADTSTRRKDAKDAKGTKRSTHHAKDAKDAKSSKHRRRRPAGPTPAVNEPLAFITFVATYPIHSEVEGEVVSFTSHGAMVDVGLPDGGQLHCYIPLSAMGDPAPTKARQVLARGERRQFELVGLDPPRRVAELALAGTAAPEESRRR